MRRPIQTVRNDLSRIEDAARHMRNTHRNADVVELADLIARLAQVVRQDIAP